MAAVYALLKTHFLMYQEKKISAAFNMGQNYNTLDVSIENYAIVPVV